MKNRLGSCVSARSLPALLFAGLLSLWSGAGTAPLHAQSESLDVKYVEIQSIKQRKEGKKHFLDVKAKTPKLPVDCKVQFILTWNYQRVQIHVVKVPSSKRIEESFEIKDYAPSPTHYVMRTQLLEPHEQPRKVKNEMAQDVKTFPPGAVPWAEHHDDKKFLIGTPEEIAEAVEKIQGWFKERWRALAGLDRKVSDAAKAVDAGEEYVNGKGEFEAKKWRDMMDKEVLTPIREYQEDFEAGLMGKKMEMLAYRMALADLREFSRAIALRTTQKSVKLYKAQGLEPAEEDLEPEGVSTNVRGFKRKRLPKSKDLLKMIARIKQGIGIVEEEEKDGEGAK